MFKKKKLIIKSNTIPIDILKNHLLSFPHNFPKYFKDIPKSFFDQQNRKIRSMTTVRSCSGFINLFKRTILFTCPYDIELFIDKNEIRGMVGSHPWNNFVMKHADWQFLEYAKSDYSCVLKFHFDIFMQCNQNVLITNPWWHLNNFEIIPGLINCKDTMDLNIFVAKRRGVNQLYIPQGTPLCYINIETEDSIKLVYNNEKFNHSSQQGLFYKFTNLKDKLIKNLIEK